MMSLLHEISEDSQVENNEDNAANSEHFKTLGNEELKNKNYTKALDYYHKALSLNPKNYAALNNRAFAYLKCERYLDTIRDTSDLLDMCPNDNNHMTLRTKALFRRALARRNMNGPEGITAALADLDLLLSIEPDNKEARAELKKTESMLQNKSTEQKSAEKTKQVARDENINAKKTPPPAATPVAPSTMPSATSDAIGLRERSTTKRKSTDKLEASASNSSTSNATASDAKSETTPKKEIKTETPYNTPNQKIPKKVSTPQSETLLASKLSITVPTEPPKTVYELERIWRGLRSRPDLFAQYLKCFKKTTFSKVFKETVSPDLLSSLFVSIRDHMVQTDPSSTILILEGMTKIPKFDMTMAVLPDEDMNCLKTVFSSLATQRNSNNIASTNDSKLENLRQQYNI